MKEDDLFMVEILLLALLILVLFQYYLLYRKNEATKENSKQELEKALVTIKTLSSQPVNTFEADVKFLLEMINHNINIITIFKLKPMQIAGLRLIENELFAELREDVVLNIYEGLSDNYKKRLLLYYSESGLLEYIVEKINIELLQSILSLQMKIPSHQSK